MTFLSTWVLFGVRSSILPLFVTEELHGTTTIVGFGFTLSALAQGLILIRAGRFSDNSGRRAALLIGFTMISIGLGFLIFATTTWMFMLAMLFFGLGGAFGGTGAALVGDVIKGRSGRLCGISDGWRCGNDGRTNFARVYLRYLFLSHRLCHNSFCFFNCDTACSPLT